MATKKIRLWGASATVGALALLGCGREPQPVVETNLEALVTPAAEFSLDREVAALEAEIDDVPMEERFSVRAERVRAAEEAARRRSVDEGGDAADALRQINERMALTAEAQAEYAAAESARIGRNESFPVTAEDRVHQRSLAALLGVPAQVEAQARAVREARSAEIEEAAAHVDPSEYSVPNHMLGDGTAEARHAD